MKCRGCMQIDCEVVELDSNVSEDGKTFYAYFNECTKLNATKTDKLPKILCINCAEKLQVAFNFISEAIRCDKELKKLLSGQAIEPSLGILEEVESYKPDPLSLYDSTEQNEIQIINRSLSDEDLLGINGNLKTEITVEILNISEAKTQHNEDSEDGSLCPRILFCDICSLEYPTINDFKAHVSELHKNDVTCTKCSKLFELPRERYLHDKLVHNKSESSMHCPWCQYCIYISRNELIEHVQTKHYKSYLKYFVPISSHNDDDNLKKYCQICFIRFSKHISYVDHMKNAHCHSMSDNIMIPMQLFESDNGNPEFPFTSTNTALTKNDETLKLEFECSECPKKFQLKKSLLRHIRQKHSGFIINNVTAKHNRKITKNKNAKISEDREEPSNEDLVACKYCNKKLVSTKISHHENRHEYRLKKRGKYLCSLCPREFASEISVKVHERRIHLHQRPEPKQCPICHKRFDTKYLKAHIANVHPTERKFVCDICGCAYKTKLYLREHKLLHIERKLPCTICNKKFVRATDLKKHMRSHTGEKPFACEVCDKRFAFKGEFNNHMQHHAGIKHKCKDCDKEFNNKKQLSIHSYKHTGMPYRCTICGYGCSRRHVFRQHLLRVHDMTMTPDEYSAMFKANTGRTTNVLPLEELQPKQDH